MQLNLF